MNEKSSDFRCSRQHVWAKKLNPNTIHLGLTDFALEKLGEIVSIELPIVGEQVKNGQTIGTVESSKMVSDLYSPVDGEVVGVNHEYLDTPQLLTPKQYQAWLVEIKLQQPEQWNQLLMLEQYLEWIKGDS